MIIKFPCGLCSDEVGDNEGQFSVVCSKWNHIGCLNIGAEKHIKLKKDPLAWDSPNYAIEMPFLTLSNKGLKQSFSEALLKL